MIKSQYAIEYASGKVGVCVSKRLANGRILLIETVSKSRGALQFKNAIGVSESKYQSDYVSVYKKRAGTNTRGSNSSNNSLHDGSNSKNSIRNSEPEVKEKFSDRDPELEKVNRVLEKENAGLKRDVVYLKELVKLQKQVTSGTKFTKSSVEAAAGQLIKAADAKGSKAELAPLLNSVYEYIAGGQELTWEGVKEEAQPAVEWLQSHVRTRTERSAYAQDVLKDIRNSKVYGKKATCAKI